MKHINEALTDHLCPTELEETETFILQAWLQEADEYMAWCEDNDDFLDHYDIVEANREKIATEIEAR